MANTKLLKGMFVWTWLDWFQGMPHRNVRDRISCFEQYHYFPRLWSRQYQS